MIDSRIDVRPISGNIGAEIHGVNIAANPSDEIIAQLRQAFTRRFGEMFIHPNHQTLHPGVLDNVREPGDERIVGEDWHADTTMMAEPPMGAILYASEVPTYSGDTCFANQYLAYETLSEGLKRTLETLRAVHTDRMSAGPQAARNSKRATKVREDADLIEILSAIDVHMQGPASVVERIRNVVGDVPAYLSFDIDALDPAFAPGTGTPEIGGLASWQAQAILRGLGGVRFNGMDVVEVAPAYDMAEITSLAAATVVWEYLALVNTSAHGAMR